MKFADSIKLFASFLVIGTGSAALHAHQIVQGYGPLTEAAKLTITGAGPPGGQQCFDFNASNCTATKSDGTLTACGAAYSGPCTGSCVGACSLAGSSTYTAQAGSTVSGYQFIDKGGNCGFVKTNGACTAVPNGQGPGGAGAVVAGAGCYCVGGTAGNAPCGTTYGLPDNTNFPPCKQPNS